MFLKQSSPGPEGISGSDRVRYLPLKRLRKFVIISHKCLRFLEQKGRLNSSHK